jgi:hypothetical protein
MFISIVPTTYYFLHPYIIPKKSAVFPPSLRAFCIFNCSKPSLTGGQQEHFGGCDERFSLKKFIFCEKGLEISDKKYYNRGRLFFERRIKQWK